MTNHADLRAEGTIAPWVIAAAVAVVLALHLVTALVTPYGLQRDEFLYLAMGAHLHLWRMDFPPAMALLAQLMRATVGVSVVALRLVPALFSAVLVAFAALFARELGGGRFAQALAAVAIIASPAFLRSGSLFQPVVLDQVAWTLALYALTRLVRTADARWWLAVGVAGGLGLLIKFSIGIIGVGVLIALIVLPDRRWLRTRWPYLAVLLAVAIGSPSIVGQIRTGWPAVLYARELSAQQLTHVTVAGFFADQAQMLGPAVLLAVAGVWEFLRRDSVRLVGVACLGALAILLVLHGKAYYLLPVYPALIGAGSAWGERLSADRAGGHRRTGVAARAIAVALVVAYGAAALPYGLPVLAPRAMARFASHGLQDMVTTNMNQVLALPQDYADMLHWRDRVAAVARVYDSLPPAVRQRTVIAATNYGEAGAIDYYGPAMGLPNAICGCGTYWFFGPGALPGDVLVTIGVDSIDLRRFYRVVQPAGVLRDRWAVPEEQDIHLYVARDPVMPLQRLWPLLDPREQPATSS
ncbi:MAG TPA: glycosyltransferase family 39 protein [Gemmatimonadaceae bacterium]|nr:glycosyltransferase family 39 protein [Gemmatimonadaceae bacterium]